MPTQEELLEEAKTTELENIKSLEKYQKLESEKKTKRTVKRAISGPVIQYKSIQMPIIEELSSKREFKEDNEQKKVCERTFISILDDPNDTTFDEVFEKKIGKPKPKRLKCAVTG